MATNNMAVGEQLYEVEAHFTGMTEFGADINAILSGQAGPPPGGARFDVAFEGTAKGDKLNGKLSGVDYLIMRADGRTELHIHATITTDDGENISFFADGVATPSDVPGIMNIRENATLSSASEKYSWLNSLQVWASGTVDPANGLIKAKGYIA